MAWTDERIEKLKALWSEGLTASQIATRLGGGVTRNAVIGKAHRLGLKSRPSSTKPEPPKPQKVAPRPAVPKAEEDGGRITLLDLTEKMCKWPIGHPGEVDFHFCGKPSAPGLPYCRAHCREAFQTHLPRRDRRNRAR